MTKEIEPLAGVAIVGYGKAGGSLGASLQAAGVRVHVVSRSPQRRSAAEAVHQMPTFETLSALFSAQNSSAIDAVFLAVPDAHIESVAKALDDTGATPSVVAHLSGARGREAIAPLLRSAEVAAAFHPLAALDGESPIPPGTLLAIDAGDDERVAQLTALAARIGGQPERIRPGEHARYHAGAVVAGNLPVALVADAIGLLCEAGVAEDSARVALARLLESTAKALQRGSLADMLTGPVARGDASTLERHLAVMGDTPLSERYRSLSQSLVEVADHDQATSRALLAALSKAPNASDDEQ